MADGSSDTMKITRKTVEIGLIVIGVVVLLSAASFYYFGRHKQQTVTNNNDTSTSGKKVLTDAQSQLTAGKDDQAIKTLKDYLATNPPNAADRYQADLQLEALYNNRKDYVAAHTYSELAINDAPSVKYTDYVSLGDSELASNNKTAAIKDYQQALTLAQKNPDTGSQGMAQYLTSKIAQLQGTQ